MRTLLLRGALGCALTAPLLSFAALAQAQEAKLVAEVDPNEAHAHFVAGQGHYAHGDFQLAADEFEAAYRLSGDVAFLRNVYEAHREAGELEIASIALRRYVNEAPDAPDHAEMAARLEELDRQLGAGVAAEPTASANMVPTPDGATEPPPPARDETGITTAWVVTSAGVALVLVGTFVGFSSLGAQSSLDDRCGASRTMCPAGFEADRDRGQTLGLVADIVGITGALTLGTGVALLFLFQNEEEAPPASVACGPEGCMATVRGSF